MYVYANISPQQQALDVLARILRNNRQEIAGLLRRYGYRFTGEQGFIKAAADALFDNPAFAVAADAVLASSYKASFIGAIISGVTSLVSSTVGAIQGKKTREAAVDIAKVNAKSALEQAYYNLLGIREVSQAQVQVSAIGLQEARTYKQFAIITGIVVGVVAVLGMVAYIFYVIFWK